MSTFLCHQDFLVTIYFNACSMSAKTKAQKGYVACLMSQNDLVTQLGVKLMLHVCQLCVFPTQLLWFEISGNNFHRHSPMHLSQVRPQSTISSLRIK